MFNVSGFRIEEINVTHISFRTKYVCMRLGYGQLSTVKPFDADCQFPHVMTITFVVPAVKMESSQSVQYHLSSRFISKIFGKNLDTSRESFSATIGTLFS